MGTQFFAAFLMLLMTLSGGSPGTRHNDLLDLIPTDAYWHAKNVTVDRAQLEAAITPSKAPADIPQIVKNLESLSRRDEAKKQLIAIGFPGLQALGNETKSEDPEAGAMARDIINIISQHAKEQDVRRLMAIRTLGERKEKESLPLLTGLGDSKELFVADYAARAIAQINGTPVKPQEFAPLADDLKMLPSTTGIVGQTTGIGLPGYTLDSLIAQMATLNPRGGPPMNDKNATRDTLTRQLLDIVEAVGNVRADGATLAISADIGGSNEWVLVSVRGVYDREAVAAYTARLQGNKPTERVGDMIRVNLDREAAILFPSDRQLVLVTANPSNTTLASLIDPISDALATGKPGTLADNKPLDELIKSIDKSGPAWIACIPSAKMRTLPIFGAFSTISAVAKEDKGVFKITATGRGTGSAQAAIEQFNTGRSDILPDLTRAVDNIGKDLQPFIDAVQSANAAVDDKGATLTATVSPEVVKGVTTLIITEFRLTSPPPTAMPPGVMVPERGLP